MRSILHVHVPLTALLASEKLRGKFLCFTFLPRSSDADFACWNRPGEVVMKSVREPCGNAFLASPFGRTVRGTFALLVVLTAILFSIQPASATQIHVTSGTFVALKLHYDLTTENVEKNDKIQLDVAENVVINNHVVIAKGAVAQGRVVRVKGAGKKRPKDGEVDFVLQRVRAVDDQWIPLRFRPQASKKSDDKSQEIVEDRPIPGLIERMFGAPKGKDYPSYVDADVVVNSPDVQPGAEPATAAQPGQPATGVAATPVAPPATATPGGPSSVAAILVPEPGTVDFSSDPPGADIFVDGSFAGSTPSTLRIDTGIHSIELRKPGYTTWSRRMVVGPSSHPTVRATLHK
jgi:PEGA domain